MRVSSTAYRLQMHQSAKRDFGKLPQSARDEITDHLSSVAEYRKPTDHPSCELLSGWTHIYRVRIDRYRAIVQLDQPDLLVLEVGKRRTVYNDLNELVASRRVN